MICQVMSWNHPGHGHIAHADGQKCSRIIATDGRLKILRSHSDHSEWMPVDLYRLPHYVRPGCKPGAPVVVAQNHHRIRAGCRIVLWSQQPSKCWLQTQYLK